MPHSIAVNSRADVEVGWTLRYLASRAIAGVESGDANHYRRQVTSASGAATAMTVTAPSERRLIVELADPAGFGPDDFADIEQRCRHLFALDESPPPPDATIWSDPVLGRLLTERPGLKLAGAWDRFETAIRIVVGQQVTVAAASTLAGRLVERAGALTPDALADADLIGLGMPNARAGTISNLAQAIVAGEVDLAHPGTLAEVVAELTAVKGIGPWTAQLIAARVHRQPDAFPPKDLGLRRSYERLGGIEPVEVAADRWSPWRATAIAHLWAAE